LQGLKVRAVREEYVGTAILIEVESGYSTGHRFRDIARRTLVILKPKRECLQLEMDRA
jgi:hypothetical protein